MVINIFQALKLLIWLTKPLPQFTIPIPVEESVYPTISSPYRILSQLLLICAHLLDENKKKIILIRILLMANKNGQISISYLYFTCAYFPFTSFTLISTGSQCFALSVCAFYKLRILIFYHLNIVLNMQSTFPFFVHFDILNGKNPYLGRGYNLLENVMNL